MKAEAPLIPPPAACAVLIDRIGPYHFARLSALAERVRTVAIECFGMDATYAWNKVSQTGTFERCTLLDRAGSDPAQDQRLVKLVSETLTRFAPSVVAIPGWSEKSALAALRWCLKTRTPAILMCASSAVGRERGGWRELIKRRLVRLFSAGLGGGRPQIEYLQSLGLTPARIFSGYNVVDNGYFSAQAQAVREDAARQRAALGLPANFFLSVCRLVEEKNLPRLLEAYAAYRREAGPGAWKFVLLGDGPLKASLLARRDALGLAQDFLMPGFKQYEELPAYYGLANAFVLPSVAETWGLVVNEAMACGLPVLVSTHCGCAADLVEEGRNGFTFDPADSVMLSRRMLELAGGDRAAMSRASREIIGRWSPATHAAHLESAANAARSVPPPRAGFLDRLLLWLLLHR